MPTAVPGPGSRRLGVLFFLDYADGQGGRFPNAPGLLSMIGYARQRGFDVRLVDEVETLLQALDDPSVDVVAFSSMERMLPRTIPLASRVRARRPELVLMVGGHSLEPFAPELAASVFDLVVTGEADHTFPALLHALATAAGRHVDPEPAAGCLVPGTASRVGRGERGGGLQGAALDAVFRATFPRALPGSRLGRVALGLGGVHVRDAATGEIWQLASPDRDALRQRLAADRSPGFELEETGLDRVVATVRTDPTPTAAELDMVSVFPWDLVRGRDWTVYEFCAQRGCRWGRCRFCSLPVREVRTLSVEKVLKFLGEAARFGLEQVSFCDDMFVQNPAWTRALLRSVVERKLGLRFRAQTLVSPAVWPLLGLMKRAGFVELAFGVETLLPERAVFLGKTRDGPRYVRDACETVVRTAAAGMCPVLYLIMVDPRSRLAEISTELRLSLELLDDVYTRSGVLPRLSYSLVLLPVAGAPLTREHPHRFQTVRLGKQRLKLPSEFILPPDVGRYIGVVAERTAGLPRRRENLEAMSHYLGAVEQAAAETQDPARDRIRDDIEAGQQTLDRLTAKLDQDVEATARALFARPAAGGVAGVSGARTLRFDVTRYGGYFSGMSRYHDLVCEALARCETVPRARQRARRCVA